jgi:tetratricopeptide (TPR) repeat protein
MFAVVAYIGTRQFADSNRAIEAHLAAVWYEAGKRALIQKDWDTAVSSFRKATVDDHSNRIYARALADALQREGRAPEARTLLLQLRETAPEDPIINLDLARIEAKETNVSEAVGYYHNALYGIWTGENVDLQRQAIRRELIQFLIAERKDDQALAEIVALAAHLPDTIATQVELGQWFLLAGDPTRSAEHFSRALQQQPRNEDALKGAGEAFFKLGDYLHARRDLIALHRPDGSTQSMLDTATEAASADPLGPQLSDSERSRRTISDLSAVAVGVQTCLARRSAPDQMQILQSFQAKLNELSPTLSPKHLQGNPDLVFTTLDLIYETEAAISKSCGELHGTDLALFLVAQKSRRSEQ